MPLSTLVCCHRCFEPGGNQGNWRAETLATFGGVDTLVYATGTNTPDRAMKQAWSRMEIWDMMLSVNLRQRVLHHPGAGACLPCGRRRRPTSFMSLRFPACWQEKEGRKEEEDASGSLFQAAERGLLGLAHAIRDGGEGKPYWRLRGAARAWSVRS